MITSIWAWLTDPAQWSGPAGIPSRLLEHLAITLAVVLIASAIAIPLGLWIAHTGRARWLVSIANSARAIPTLGLLFALQMWWQPHLAGNLAFLVPCIVALVVLAIPPILSGTYAGVEAIDPATTDAATGLGMNPSGVVRGVQLPLAAPLIVSGLRSAFLQVIATATIAAYTGLGGLGRYLIDGIAQNDYPQTAGGALLVALLALLAEAIGVLISSWLAHRYPQPGQAARAPWSVRLLSRKAPA